MKIFVINLEQDKSRLESMKVAFLKYNLDFERFPAVNGKSLPRESRYNVYSGIRAWWLRRSLLPGEIGCALSHIYLYKKIVEEKLPYALILEDDIEISSELKKFLDDISEKLKPEQNTVIMVGPRSWNVSEKRENIREDSKVVLRRSFSPYRTCGYIVTSEAAKRLSNFLLPCRTVADDWARFERYGLVKIWTTEPLLVSLADSSNRTTIGDRTINNDFFSKSFRVLRRFTVEKVDFINAVIYRLIHRYGER